jgi:hypothetical protein
MLKISDILGNIKYVSIIAYLNTLEKSNFENPELKHFSYFFLENHGLSKKNVRKMEKDFLKGSKIEFLKDVYKKILHTHMTYEGTSRISGFKTKQDINGCLKRLYPYVVYVKPNSHPKKYYLSDIFYDEYLKYEIIQLMNNFDKKIKINGDFVEITYSKEEIILLSLRIQKKYVEHIISKLDKKNKLKEP